MKKVILLFVLCSIIGCTKSGDDDNGNTTSGTIVGKWDEFSTYKKKNGVWVKDDWEYEPNVFVLEFLNNGKVIQYDEGVKTFEVNYSYNSNTKELILMGLSCIVEELTSTKLVVVGDTISEDRFNYKTEFKRIN